MSLQQQIQQLPKLRAVDMINKLRELIEYHGPRNFFDQVQRLQDPEMIRLMIINLYVLRKSTEDEQQITQVQAYIRSLKRRKDKVENMLKQVKEKKDYEDNNYYKQIKYESPIFNQPIKALKLYCLRMAISIQILLVTYSIICQSRQLKEVSLLEKVLSQILNNTLSSIKIIGQISFWPFVIAIVPWVIQFILYLPRLLADFFVIVLKIGYFLLIFEYKQEFRNWLAIYGRLCDLGSKAIQLNKQRKLQRDRDRS